MYTFRFNPVFQQWVILGEPVPHTLILQDGHKIVPTLQDAPDFFAATYPRQPFLLDPEHIKKHEDDLLYAPQSPVGEYELLMYSGSKSFFEFSGDEWGQWLLLLSERFRHIHMNPHLHFAMVRLLTRGLQSAGPELLRVGDLIAASHPLSGMSVTMPHDLIHKLIEKERLFVIHHSEHGALYIPTAPLHEHELWYLPKTTSTLDSMSASSRSELAEILSAVFAVLGQEFPGEFWSMTVHTPMAGVANDSSWWIQFHQEVMQEASILPLKPFPERFAFTMRHVLAHRLHHKS